MINLIEDYNELRLKNVQDEMDYLYTKIKTEKDENKAIKFAINLENLRKTESKILKILNQPPIK
jgi:hypothetical protein